MNDDIFNQTVGNLYWKDRNGVYLGCNKAFATILGFNDPTEIIGKTDRTLTSPKLSFKNIDEVERIDQEIIKTGFEKVIQEIGYDIFGKRVVYFTKKSPLRDKNNVIIGIIGTSLDISEYEDVKDLLINHSAGNLYWKNTQGIYLGCNEAFAKILNLNSPQEIIGKNDYDFFLAPEFIEKIMEIDSQVIRTGEEITLEEIGTGIGGKIAIYLTKKVPLKDKSGNIIGVMGTSLDITKEKQAEQAKAEFITNMSHDLRTPFSGILSLAECLLEEETDPIKKELQEDVVASAKRLLAVLNQVIEVASLGDNPIKMEEFNIKDVIDEISKLYQAKIRIKNLKLDISCENHFITSDRSRIQSILINLISNAVKFTEYGKISINVKKGNRLKIEIIDTGIGLSEENIPIIFNKFSRLKPSDKEEGFTGAGIGLYIAKQAAKEIGGDITVQSKLGEGSTFTFFL